MRKAIPYAKKELKDLEIIEIWMTNNGSWEWFVHAIEDNGLTLRVLVFSPNTPKGEFGTVWRSELNDLKIRCQIVQLDLKESLPPSGYSWEE